MNIGIVLVATMLSGNYLGARDLLIPLGAVQGWKKMNSDLLCSQQRVDPRGKALASTEATSGNTRQKGICKRNHVLS